MPRRSQRRRQPCGWSDVPHANMRRRRISCHAFTLDRKQPAGAGPGRHGIAVYNLSKTAPESFKKVALAAPFTTPRSQTGSYVHTQSQPLSAPPSRAARAKAQACNIQYANAATWRGTRSARRAPSRDAFTVRQRKHLHRLVLRAASPGLVPLRAVRRRHDPSAARHRRAVSTRDRSHAAAMAHARAAGTHKPT